MSLQQVDKHVLFSMLLRLPLINLLKCREVSSFLKDFIDKEDYSLLKERMRILLKIQDNRKLHTFPNFIKFASIASRSCIRPIMFRFKGSRSTILFINTHFFVYEPNLTRPEEMCYWACCTAVMLGIFDFRYSEYIAPTLEDSTYQKVGPHCKLSPDLFRELQSVIKDPYVTGEATCTFQFLKYRVSDFEVKLIISDVPDQIDVCVCIIVILAMIISILVM